MPSLRGAKRRGNPGNGKTWIATSAYGLLAMTTRKKLPFTDNNQSDQTIFNTC